LKVSNVLHSLLAVGNSFKIVQAEKLKEHLLKLIVLEGFRLVEWRQHDAWYTCRRFMRTWKVMACPEKVHLSLTLNTSICLDQYKIKQPVTLNW